MENQTLSCTTCGRKAGWLQVTSAFSYKPNGTELTRKPKRALDYICRRRYCAYCGNDITARVIETAKPSIKSKIPVEEALSLVTASLTHADEKIAELQEFIKGQTAELDEPKGQTAELDEPVSIGT